ncbi:phage portal protein [Clostridium botulinum]|uniref:phage portal protein n=1 Tax=Clostridium botulinum TaxID=1491 RepID=UPI001A91B418|nr:phage portal protein [Clostridium botulinum]MBO0537919.1 phage portal protein [Clostridium botulinum]MBO0580370.1 phage portal protein [Clostridium botulinum]
MKIVDWIRNFFDKDTNSIQITQGSIATLEAQLAIEEFALTSAINLVASTISKCEIKTYLKNKEIKSDEYYLWNIEPNKNQNSSQFIQELISKLLYCNECLVIEVNGQLIIADSFYQSEYAIVENYFTNVSKGTMSFNRNFKMSDVLYFKLSNTDIRPLLKNIMYGYNKLINMAIGKYKRSGGRKGILDIDATAAGTKDFQAKFQDLMDNKFKKYFEAENAVLPLHKGYNYQEQNGEGNKKSTSEIVDIQNLTKEAFDRAAQALKMPPSLLRGDIADIGAITDNYLTFCIDPIVSMLKEEINRKRYGKAIFLSGTYLDIDTTCIKHLDIFAVAEKVDKLLASGIYSIDELRTKLRDTTINLDWSEKHWITKNYQDINNLEGSENIE